MRVTWLGLGPNVLLSFGKGVAGAVSGSTAMTADVVHSASDTISDVVTILSLRFSRRPADDLHPYGYGRSGPLGALAISCLVTLAGIGIGAHSFEALRDMLAGESAVALAASDVVTISNAPVALAAALGSVALGTDACA